MYGRESWTVKKAEHRISDAFEMWHWRRLLRVPWTARRSNQSILKEISPGISLEGMMLKLILWPPHEKSRLTGKDFEGLGAGGEGDDRGWDGWMVSLTRWTWIWELQELVTDREAWPAAIHGIAKSRTRLSDWTELKHLFSSYINWSHLHSLDKVSWLKEKKPTLKIITLSFPVLRWNAKVIV